MTVYDTGLPGDTILGHLAVDLDRRPDFGPPVPPSVPVILTDDYWLTIEQRAAARRSETAVARMEIRSYYSAEGQSSREDCHRAYADLYGMQPTPAGFSNGYTTFAKLRKALNTVVNLNEGLTESVRRQVVLTWDDHTFTVTRSLPAATCQQALGALSALCMWGAPAKPIPEWRIRDGKCDVLRTVVKPRPAEVTYVVEEQKMAPVWSNPYQIDDGFTILATSPERSFAKPGLEGLSILRDSTDRLHLVYWTTEEAGRRTRKRPLYVHSFTLDVEDEEALNEMNAVSAAMSRTVREDGVLAWQAAALAGDVEDLSVPTISGSMTWLAAVSDGQQAGLHYRNTGAHAD